ncbi:WAT1-related protein isoform X1, partial [Tanacetum coccineum]
QRVQKSQRVQKIAESAEAAENAEDSRECRKLQNEDHIDKMRRFEASMDYLLGMYSGIESLIIIRGWQGLPYGFALVKCTFAIRQLAYAAVPDSLDEYLQIGKKTSRDCLMHFCNKIIELYGEDIHVQNGRDSCLQSIIVPRSVKVYSGSNNDINVLRQSLVLNDLKVGKALEVPFVANDVTYKWGYYLTDEIYPE